MDIHISIDIETFGTENNSALLSLGAKAFTLDDRHIYDGEFYKVIDVADCINLGLTVTKDTLEWWIGSQTEELKKLFQESPLPLSVVLPMFTRYFNDLNNSHEILGIWAYPPSFDISIIESAYRISSLKAPWQELGLWRQLRCARTLFDVSKFNYRNYLKEKGVANVPHNALEDAKLQSYAITDALLKLR